ncbi:hypothetical protein INR77_09075 [Erythrobacter sp. SCSIO 43205]|nr:hypothetical protein INR77_09075 [Erythrobacter sp. SCSIO 43205]
MANPESDGRILCWFSSGAASAVMTKLILAENPEAIPVQCDLGDSEDADNRRFTQECEEWFGKPVLHIKSEKYDDIDEVFDARKYHSGMNGAPCTGELKTAPRLDFQRPSDLHVWGYTADPDDTKRFKRMQRVYPEMKQRAPLIERGITKEGCLAIIERAAIAPPRVYSLGFTNANCIGCVKSTSPAYWALVRKQFPNVFERRAKQSRRFGSRLTHLPKQGDERFFIDEIPADFPTKEAVSPQCDFLCALAEEDLT